MKKILCLLLAMLLVVGLCGCFAEQKDVRGEISNNQGDQTHNSTGESENKTDEDPVFSLGTNANNTYKNDFLGISCTLPAEWKFATDEEILAMNNVVSDVVGDEIAEMLQNAPIIYDMYAAYEEAGCNINVNLEKLNLLQGVVLNIRQSLEAQIDTIVQAYQNMGYTDIAVEYQTITVDGKEFDGLKLTAKIYGMDFYGTVFSFKKGNYLAAVSISTLQIDQSDAILSYFTIK